MANEIRGIMIPVTSEKKILLPNAIIAEVVSFKDIHEIVDSPKWLVGNFNWRGYEVPVINYETLSAETKQENDVKGRVAVIKALGNLENIPYFAIIVKGVPRLQVVTQGDLQVHEVVKHESNAIASIVTINDEMSEIPNIRYLEHVLSENIDSPQ